MTGAAALRVVLDMQDRRPVWAMPSWVSERIGEALPHGSSLHVIEAPNDGSGDGWGRVSPEVLEAVADADAYLGYGIGAEILQRGECLRWVHTGAAGVRGSLHEEMRSSPVIFTNSAGVHSEPMAETALAMILYLMRGLDLAMETRSHHHPRWDPQPFYEADAPLRELSQSTVGIVGFGGVGRALARRCIALGARVLALRRRPVEPDESGRGVGVGVLSGLEGMARLLETSDVVVLAVPETDETRGMIGEEAIARMRPDSVLINVGRGGLVDSEALLAALRDRRLRGAGLDVFRTEPIPDDHPLWELPNVIVTPHVSAVTHGYWERESTLIVDNIGRLVSGEPLLNVVDKELGY